LVRGHIATIRCLCSSAYRLRSSGSWFRRFRGCLLFILEEALIITSKESSRIKLLGFGNVIKQKVVLVLAKHFLPLRIQILPACRLCIDFMVQGSTGNWAGAIIFLLRLDTSCVRFFFYLLFQRFKARFCRFDAHVT